MLALSMFDLATRSMSGFVIRNVLPRTAPPILIGSMDNRTEMDKDLPSADFLIGAGHGSPTTFHGQDKQVVLEAGNLPDVKDKVIWLLSCESCLLLGPAMVFSGAKSFVGFTEDLLWMADPKFQFIPWSDGGAAYVMKPITDGLNALLDGKTVKEAYDIQKSGFLNSLANIDDEVYAQMIQSDIDSCWVLGDQTATIKPRPKIYFPIPPPPIILVP